MIIAAPNVSAANAVNINVQLPAGYSIAGTIRNAAGAVLPGAQVIGIATNGFGFAQTDSTGKYKMQGLVAGAYQVLVYAPSAVNLVDGYYTTANANHFTTSSASATKVTVSPSKTGIDVKLPTGYTVAGTIQTTGGAALAGVSVSIVGPSTDSAITDAAGKYTLKGLGAGSYKLALSGPSNSSYLRGWYSTANANHFVLSPASASALTLGPSKTGVNAKIPTGYSISGKITNAAGGALAYAGVGASSSSYSNSTSADASGNYTIKGLAAGTYKLSITAPSNTISMDGYYTSANANHFTSSAAGATGVAVGPSKTGVNVKVANGWSISGMVTTTTGTPLQDAYVSANSGGHYRTAYTDAAGKYTLKGLNSGAQTLSVEPPYNMNYQGGFYTTANSNHFTPAAASAVAITVGPSKTGINIKLPTAYTISGKITGPGAVALSGASVYASASNGAGYASTIANGTYKIIGLVAGTYKISVSPPYTSPTLQSGYYTTVGTSHFTSVPGSASGVHVGP
jgi:protocatechuate 3,4-dioxygenase beta subunit